MGTPMFAVPILKSLYQNGYPITNIYTQPPQKSKRGQRINKSPIQGIAETLNLEFRSPKYLKDNHKEISEWKIEGPYDSSYSLAILNRELALAMKSNGITTYLKSTEGPGDYAANMDYVSKNEKLSKIQPSPSNAYQNLGKLNIMLGKKDEAIKYYKLAIQYEPENLLHYYALSDLDEKSLNADFKNKIDEIKTKNNSKYH